MTLRVSRRFSMSGSLLGFGVINQRTATQVRPIGIRNANPRQIRTKFFAGYCGSGFTLDCRSSIDGYWSEPNAPLIDGWWSYVYQSRKLCLASNDFAGTFYGIHAGKGIAMLTLASSHAFRNYC